MIVSRARGEKGTKEWKSEWKSVIQSNLVRAKWRCAESLLSVGWQDELLVNDCPLRQKADFFFPTSDVCVSAAVFPSCFPPKYWSFFTYKSPPFLHLSIVFICVLLCAKCQINLLQQFPAQHKAPLKVLAYLWPTPWWTIGHLRSHHCVPPIHQVKN